MKARFGLLLALTALMVLPATAQLSSEFTGMHNLKRQKWEKAKGQFLKVLVKDTSNSAALYGLAIYYFSPANSAYQIDSAYQYVIEALLNYPVAPQRQRDRWRKVPMDSVILVMHRERIDSAAFERSLKINSEEGYADFANRHPTASQKSLALELRDEVAYLDALRVNTYQSFLTYLNKYPNAARAPEAKGKYEKLLFESKTKDKKLKSYEAFMAENPSTPYRKFIEQQIFEIITAVGNAEAFEIFIKKYPKSSNTNTARNILYYILKEEDASTEGIRTDSIRKIEMLENYYLVPFLKGDQFGFMNERGEDVLVTDANTVDKAYRCGNILDKILKVNKKIIARNGAVIYHGEYDEAEELGYGFLKITTSTCVRVVHYSGWMLGANECLEDAFVLGKNYVALQNKSKWSVWTLTGRMLLPFEYEEVRSIGNILVLGQSGKYRITSVEALSKIANQVVVQYRYVEVDEVKHWSDEKLWVRINDRQAVLNQDLSEWIPLDHHEISSTFFGAIAHKGFRYSLFYQKGNVSRTFDQVKIINPWIAVKAESGWELWDSVEANQRSYDSVGFLGPMAVGYRKDSVFIHMGQSFIETVRTAKLQFLPGKDSVYFLLVDEGERKRMYNSKAEKMFILPFDNIEYNNEGFFTMYKKDKKGLVASDGKVIIQPEYDGLGTVTAGIVTTLKERKFGLHHVHNRQQIKPEYEKNLVKYNDSYLIASRNGLNGFIRWDNKPITAFEFEEVKYWNDSSALVKKNFNWILYNFIERKIILDKIKRFKWVTDLEQEKILIFQQENKYGVLSSTRGIVIAPTFSDIINLGSSATPLYFTEKHVEEAGIYVVIYYDMSGRQLRKQVFEVEEYEKIFCNRNN